MSSRAIEFAEGWAELGLFDEAALELEKLSPRSRASISAQKVWVRIHFARNAWSEVAHISERILEKRPRDHALRLPAAEALHKLGRSQEAVFTLAQALGSPAIKESAESRYCLARYFCGAGNISEAREVLRSAIERNASLRMKALMDPDLEKIWVHFQK